MGEAAMSNIIEGVNLIFGGQSSIKLMIITFIFVIG